MFEGDIVGVPSHIILQNNSNFSNPSQTQNVAFRWEYARWPNGIVPYVISHHFVKTEKYIIRRAIKQIEDKTCIRFVNRTLHGTYLNIRKIYNNRPCHSVIGFQDNGPRNLNIHVDCLTIDEVLHELMHALGFYHEHTRVDSTVDNTTNFVCV